MFGRLLILMHSLCPYAYSIIQVCELKISSFDPVALLTTFTRRLINPPVALLTSGRVIDLPHGTVALCATGRLLIKSTRQNTP